jgi:membrane protease YdiL (CAAX protease family)
MTVGTTGAERIRLIVELSMFLGLAYGLTWTICGAYIFAPKAMTPIFGIMKTGSPIFFVAVYAPSLCGVALTLVREGPRGLARVAASAIRLAGRWPWIIAGLAGYPLLWLAVAVLQSLDGGRGLGAVPYEDWYAALPLVLLSGFILRDAGPLGEELGWRGYALPRLLALTGPRRAAVLLGAIWAIWHIPAFFLGGLSQSKFHFEAFFFEVIGFSVAMTLIYLHTRGSVLLAGILPHMWINAVSKAGIHPLGWVTIALAAIALVLGGRAWRTEDGTAARGRRRAGG